MVLYVLCISIISTIKHTTLKAVTLKTVTLQGATFYIVLLATNCSTSQAFLLEDVNVWCWCNSDNSVSPNSFFSSLHKTTTVLPWQIFRFHWETWTKWDSHYCLYIWFLCIFLENTSQKKCFLSGIARRRGGGPCPIFFDLFLPCISP